MSHKPRLFYKNGDCCERLFALIDKESDRKNFITHDVEDPDVSKRLPSTYKKVPILVVKGMKQPLIGREVFVWVSSQKYMNMNTHDVNNKSELHEFRVPKLLAREYDTNSAALDIKNGTVVEKDDKKMNQTMLYFEDWDKAQISSDMTKRYKDTRLKDEVQQKKLKQLEQERNITIESIMDKNKKFV